MRRVGIKGLAIEMRHGCKAIKDGQEPSNLSQGGFSCLFAGIDALAAIGHNGGVAVQCAKRVVWDGFGQRVEIALYLGGIELRQLTICIGRRDLG